MVGRVDENVRFSHLTGSTWSEDGKGDMAW